MVSGDKFVWFLAQFAKESLEFLIFTAPLKFTSSPLKNKGKGRRSGFLFKNGKIFKGQTVKYHLERIDGSQLPCIGGPHGPLEIAHQTWEWRSPSTNPSTVGSRPTHLSHDVVHFPPSKVAMLEKHRWSRLDFQGLNPWAKRVDEKVEGTTNNYTMYVYLYNIYIIYYIILYIYTICLNTFPRCC